MQLDKLTENIDKKTRYWLDRLRICGILIGVEYILTTICSHCHRENGWNDFRQKICRWVDDNAIPCQWCHKRWVPTLEVINDQNKRTFPLITPNQILNKISIYNKDKSNYIETVDPCLYHWTMIHFGCIRTAFKKAGIRYTGERGEWRDKYKLVQSLITKSLSDYELGEILGADHCQLSTLRKEK